MQIPDLQRVDPHDPAARRVHGDRVLPRHQHSGVLGRALDRAVALHPDDSIYNREVPRKRCVQVGDAFFDSGPVQHVLGPAINGARHNAEKIFHRQRRSNPVVRLHLGHRNQKVRAQRDVGQIQFLDARKLRDRPHARHVIHVEVYEIFFKARNNFEVARRVGQVQRITPMPRAFGDMDCGRPHGAKGFICGVHHNGMRVDAASRFELHQIGFEQNVLPAHIAHVLAQQPPHRVIHALVVSGHAPDRYRRNRRCRTFAGTSRENGSARRRG